MFLVNYQDLVCCESQGVILGLANAFSVRSRDKVDYVQKMSEGKEDEMDVEMCSMSHAKTVTLMAVSVSVVFIF